MATLSSSESTNPASTGARIILFPGVEFMPNDPDENWTECETCGEELMVGDICVFCAEREIEDETDE